LTNILAQDGAFVKNFTIKIKLTRLIFLRAIRTTTQSNYLIISERDIIRTVARRDDVFSLPVSQVMTKEIIIGLPQDDLMSVAHTMTEKRFRHVRIVEQGELVGIVSIGDIVKYQRDEYEGELDTLQTQIVEDE